MKIGILTFHCAHNYGAILQCYALQEVLKGMGHQVEVIDYRPASLIAAYKIWNPHRFIARSLLLTVKRLIKETIILPKRIFRYKKFDRFINKWLNLSLPNTVSPSYDIYIMGSDQIWNPLMTKGFEDKYFGYFSFPKNQKRYVAYAASMEAECLTKEEMEYYVKALENFDAIGVRESVLASLLQPLTTTKISTVLDPTLLADVSIWNSFLIRKKRRPYVLVYQTRYDKNVMRISHCIAEQLHAEIVVLTTQPTWRLNKAWKSDASPSDFVNLISSATCVVTTSFHAVTFSVIFKRPFYCIQLGKGDIRLRSLLMDIQLSDRMVEKNSVPIFQPIDFGNSDKCLHKLRQLSYQFLLSSLIQA